MPIKNQHKLIPGDRSEMLSKMPIDESNPLALVHIDAESKTSLSNVLVSDAVVMIAIKRAP